MKAFSLTAALALTLAVVIAPALCAPALEGSGSAEELDVAANEAVAPRYLSLSSETSDNSIQTSGKQVYYEVGGAGETQITPHQEQTGTEVAVNPTAPASPINLGGIMSSVWDLVVSWVRGFLGLSRRDPPRIARAILGAAAGEEQCWKTTACQAGRLLRNLHEKEFLFMMMERLSPDPWKGVVKGMRRSAIDNEDCSSFKCDA